MPKYLICVLLLFILMFSVIVLESQHAKLFFTLESSLHLPPSVSPSYAQHDKNLQRILGLSSLRSTEEILSSEWVGKLTQMLGEPNAGKQVSVVFATYSYLESVLIAAQVRLEPPLTDVIVFCLDEKI